MAKAPAKSTRRRTPAVPAVDTSIVAEPAWQILLPDAAERAVAAEHWRRIVGEMTERQILSSSNGHAIQRLVLAYLVYDRCTRQLAAEGVVEEPNKENPKAIARLSIHYKAMREAEKTTERLEAQLGLSPGRRGKVAKVTKQRQRTAGADAFLGPGG
ncbi:hypothetical protein GCM10011380_08750 [Sphingomonas metalli]|uniref:Phage terminase small subunit P27 family n=1 Tax=Sphingomonas metalli TaxID=1779358 RepID=A0A916SWW4_9SPHN|nr:P27 family phage terminase small subunit [Sphingomonas metalli]GGB21433.1 hypothetical protein GCM10011380_08750 [Sphingomonas metalli]